MVQPIKEGNHVKMVNSIFRGKSSEEGRIYKVMSEDDIKGETKVTLIKVGKRDGEPLKYKQENVLTLPLTKLNRDGSYTKRNGETVQVFEPVSGEQKKQGVERRNTRNDVRAFEAGFSEGDFIYASWGYDQTNIDFAKIIEVSDTGKTVLAQRIPARGLEGGTKTHENIMPRDEPYGEPFRLHVREAGSSYVLKGSYPYGSYKSKSEDSRKGTFFDWDRTSVTETRPGMGH